MTNPNEKPKQDRKPSSEAPKEPEPIPHALTLQAAREYHDRRVQGTRRPKFCIT
jgi:hypothetical protein